MWPLEYWNKHGFELMVVFSLIVIVCYILYCKLSGMNARTTKMTLPRMPNIPWPHLMNSFRNMATRSVLKKSPSVPKAHSYQGEHQPSRKRVSHGEQECRRVLEHLFHRPFPSARPNFLRNPVTGNSFNLELDCFNPELRLAVEYNGVQHYKYTPYFHKTKESFLIQKYRDDMKRRICKEVGVHLIEVPNTVTHGQIQSFLRSKLHNAGYNV